jgi:hypothetical protein
MILWYGLIARDARPLRIAALVGALLGAGAGTASADGPEGVSLFPRTSRERAGLYLLPRPIVPVAAGRLCAEADRAGRFSSTP